MNLAQVLTPSNPPPAAPRLLVRLALEDEADACVELARMQTAETLPHIPFCESRARETFKRYLDTANPTIFVCEGADRSIIGMLIATMSSYAFATGLCINQEVLYVHPDHRHSRAAVRLVEHFSEWADRLDAREVFTGVSNDVQAERVARLFQRCGFAPVGTYLRKVR